MSERWLVMIVSTVALAAGLGLMSWYFLKEMKYYRRENERYDKERQYYEEERKKRGGIR